MSVTLRLIIWPAVIVIIVRRESLLQPFSLSLCVQCSVSITHTLKGETERERGGLATPRTVLSVTLRGLQPLPSLLDLVSLFFSLQLICVCTVFSVSHTHTEETEALRSAFGLSARRDENQGGHQSSHTYLHNTDMRVYVMCSHMAPGARAFTSPSCLSPAGSAWGKQGHMKSSQYCENGQFTLYL